MKLYSVVIANSDKSNWVLHMGRYGTLEEAIDGGRGLIVDPAQRSAFTPQLYASLDILAAESQMIEPVSNDIKHIDPQKQTKQELAHLLMYVRDTYIPKENTDAIKEFNDVIKDLGPDV